MESYTLQQRRAILKGLRILARVAIRSFMEERAAGPRPRTTARRSGEKDLTTSASNSVLDEAIAAR